VVKNGNHILIDPLPELPEGVLQLILLGSVISVLLHQRGYLVLHASAVAIGETVVAFIGQKGAGKTTTAAALHARGHTLLTDDVVVISTNDSAEPVVLPGYPQFKLWPETAKYLGLNPDELNHLVDVPTAIKRAGPVEQGFASTPLPLQGLYLLNVGDSVEIQRVTAQQAFLELMPHWQSARQGVKFAKTIGSPDFFRKETDLLAMVPVYRFTRPLDFSLFPAAIDQLEAHVAGLVPAMRTDSTG
jgi:hypothetical protein